MLTLPDVPVEAEPLRKTKEPLLPSDEVPDFIEIAPLLPCDPLFMLRTENVPLLVLRP